jgi:hypothetical protein
MENLIYYPLINLNLEAVKQIVLENQFNKDQNLNADHHRSVSNIPYLKEIYDCYPFLSEIYNVYTLPGKKCIPLHVDANRSAAFNIPIMNTENSQTIFCEYKETPALEYDPKNIFNLIKSEVREVFRFTLIVPTIINNSVPHMVINNSDKPRVILSWSIKKEYSFEDIKRMFSE